MLNEWIAHLSSLLTEGQHLFAVAQTSKSTDMDVVYELYGGEPLIMLKDKSPDWTPHVYAVEEVNAGNDLLERLIKYGVTQNAAAFFIAPQASVQSVTSHLRRFVLGRDRALGTCWIQFWDAVVAPSLFKHINANEHAAFFAEVEHVVVHDYLAPDKPVTISKSAAPKAQEEDKPATWDKKGVWRIRPELQAALLADYDGYRGWILAQSLMEAYPHERLSELTQATDWMQAQITHINTRPNVESWETKQNFITAAWLTDCEVKELPEHLDLPGQSDVVDVYQLSKKALKCALRHEYS